MPVRVVQRITLNFSVVSGMIYQHVCALFVASEAVMSRPELPVLGLRGEYRTLGFMPAHRIHQIAVDVCSEEADTVIFVGGAGGIGDENFITVFDHRRSLINPKTDDFPVQLRLAEHDGR
ncbi:hypothetical protein SRABI106_04116 [Rahnella aquatilis]|nr:hypothetical protein SRABI106_04116 [Rahnella aquatilis]